MALISTVIRSVVPHLLTTSNSSIKHFLSDCNHSFGSKIIHTIYAFINTLLLPLYIFILLMGFQQWKRQRSAAPGRSNNHSDFLTYQMMMVEIIGVLGNVFYCLGTNIKSDSLIMLGTFLLCFVFPGQTLFHVLTSIERYLAVVHAIKYMQLRETVKIRVRNISTAAVWLYCFMWLGLAELYLPRFPTEHLFASLAISLIVSAFCCLSVLYFLRCPRSGDAKGQQPRSDQSKRRAFNMLLAITVTLALRIIGILLSVGVDHLISVHIEYLCALINSSFMLTLPSNLVLPLLFLHRTGKLSLLREKFRKYIE